MDLELVLDAQSEVGESPVWDIRTGSLWWVDLLRGELHRWSVRHGWMQWAPIGQSLGFIVPTEDDGFVAGTRDGFGLIGANGQFTLITSVEIDRPTFRMNDGKCDRQGRLWAGTMSDATHEDGRLYKMTAGWRVEQVFERLSVPNGIGWTHDGTLMYFADTGRARLELWQFDPSEGKPTEWARVIKFTEDQGGPDGLTVDEEDCAWVCLWGGSAVHRYSPTGDLLEVISIPAPHVASCAFGGDNLKDLYITTARYGLTEKELQKWPASGGLFRCRPGVRGVLPDAYRNV